MSLNFPSRRLASRIVWPMIFTGCFCFTISAQDAEFEPSYLAWQKKVDAAAAENDRETLYWSELRNLAADGKEAIAMGDVSTASEKVDQIWDWRRPVSNRSLKSEIHRLFYRSIEALSAERAVKLIENVNQLCKNIPDRLKKADRGSDLEPLLNELALIGAKVIENRGVKQQIDQRYLDKLENSTRLVRTFASYLDAKSVGDAYSANRELEDALRITIGETVFSSAEAVELKVSETFGLEKIFKGIESVDQFAELKQRYGKWKDDAPAMAAKQTVVYNEMIDRLLDVSAHYSKGNYELALVEIDRIGSHSLVRKLPEVQPLISGALRIAVAKVAESFTDLAIDADQSLRVYLTSSIAVAIEASDYESAYRLLVLLEENVPRSELPDWVAEDLQGLRGYVTGQRFAQVGDGSTAIKHFRDALSVTKGKYTPIKLTLAAMEKLGSQNPEWLNTPNNELIRKVAELEAAISREKRERIIADQQLENTVKTRE